MISIVTPVLNGDRYIRHNIESIAKLKIEHEHLIVDGGSTDKTLSILRDYAHPKLIMQNDSQGMYGAIDQGFKAAKYDIISWVNADDEVFPKNYIEAVNILSQSDAGILYGNAKFLWEKSGKETFQKANRFGKYFLNKGILPFVQPSTIFKKEVYFNHALNYNDFKICGDLDMFVRMALDDDVEFKYIPKVLSKFRKYGESLGDRNHDLYLKEKKMVLRNPTVLDKILYKVTRFV